eukprot:scaffold226368_cov26-Tisochrysis_lutea.AAC.3
MTFTHFHRKAPSSIVANLPTTRPSSSAVGPAGTMPPGLSGKSLSESAVGHTGRARRTRRRNAPRWAGAARPPR